MIPRAVPTGPANVVDLKGSRFAGSVRTYTTNAGLMAFSAQRRMRMKRVFFMALNVSERISTNKPDGGVTLDAPSIKTAYPPVRLDAFKQHCRKCLVDLQRTPCAANVHCS